MSLSCLAVVVHDAGDVDGDVDIDVDVNEHVTMDDGDEEAYCVDDGNMMMEHYVGGFFEWLLMFFYIHIYIHIYTFQCFVSWWWCG
eukprot:m.55476 g.55476  ORF g.55476 m.55476 type:complete len:86 (-) comp22080_c0_seq1:69-326(-)